MHARSLLLSLTLVAAPVAAQQGDTTVARTLGAAPERISLPEALQRAPRVQPSTVQAAGANLTVRADPQQIEQVLINLLKNAGEALAGRGGQVILRGARDDHGKVLIQVIDNGPGVDAEHLDDIFLQFFTTKRLGSGVGLSVSRQIMALNKGALTVKTAVGTGCEFSLRFR